MATSDKKEALLLPVTLCLALVAAVVAMHFCFWASEKRKNERRRREKAEIELKSM